jgi:hypothetical protein
MSQYVNKMARTVKKRAEDFLLHWKCYKMYHEDMSCRQLYETGYIKVERSGTGCHEKETSDKEMRHNTF